MANALILKPLIQSLSISIREFEFEIGAGQSSITRALQRNSKLSTNIVDKILKRYPNVNKDYLLSGKGELFLSKSIDNKLITEKNISAENTDWKALYYEEKDRLIEAQEREIQLLRKQISQNEKNNKEETSLKTVMLTQIAHSVALNTLKWMIAETAAHVPGSGLHQKEFLDAANMQFAEEMARVSGDSN